MKRVKLVCLAMAMLCAIPCFGNVISFDGNWKNKHKSIIIDLPIGATFEEDSNTLLLNFQDDLDYSKDDVKEYIEKGIWIRLNYCIQPYWDEVALTNYLLIYEQDGGRNKDWNETLTIQGWGGDILSAVVSIPYEGNDDILYSGMLLRNFVFSSENRPYGEWYRYKEEGKTFEVTLPNGVH